MLLLVALQRQEARASRIGKRHNNLVHSVEKAQAKITARPLEKREATICPSGYGLCPASLNGGCCPPRYGCATDSCYATTAGTSSACGRVGYYNCGADVGGGCCPEGYICDTHDCVAPTGVTNTYTNCPASYYLCPSSFNYGCCMSGFGCGTDACYVTAPSTVTYTRTATTTNGAGQTVTTTQTATTIQTPIAPTALPTSSDSMTLAKFIPTAVDKVVASDAPSSDNHSGLTPAQLGGIIGAAVAVLILVIIAAIIVLRRLSRVARAVESRKASSSGGNRSKSQRPNVSQSNQRSENDVASSDPLIMTPSGNNSGTGTPRGPNGDRSRDRSNSDYSTSQQQTPYRFPSGTPPENGGPGYFDIPVRVHNMPGRHSLRTSTDSQGNQYTYHHQQHGRHWSNASDFSNGSSDGQHGVGSPLIPAELDIAGGFIPELPSSIDTGDAGNRRRSGSSAIGGSPRPSLNQHARRRSDGYPHSRTRSDSSATSAGGPSGSGPSSPLGPGVVPGPPGNHQPLDPVNESAEVMHGYYGPRDAQAGQTAAGLDVQDLTTPTGVRFQGFD